MSVKFTENLYKLQTPSTHFFAVVSSSIIGLLTRYFKESEKLIWKKESVPRQPFNHNYCTLIKCDKLFLIFTTFSCLLFLVFFISRNHVISNKFLFDLLQIYC